MASPTDIRKGKVIIYKNEPHIALEVLHRTQGRQAGFVQTTLRNLSTGTSTSTKFRSTDSVKFCHTGTKKLEFSYAEASGYHFMDPETFEDVLLNVNLIDDQQKLFLAENKEYDILLVDGKPVQVQLPASVNMQVTESPEGIRGDTASNVQKTAVTETGLKVQVPLFIKKDEVIKVSTADGSYVSRA